MKKLRFLYLIVFIINIYSCQGKNQIINETKNQSSNDLESNDIICEEVIKSIIKSSNLELNNYDDFLIEIESVENDTLTIHVYSRNNLSDNFEQKEIVETTIAWLLFIPDKKKLLNISYDPENPIKLVYSYNNDKLYDLCGISKLDKKDNDCQNISSEMSDCNICLVKNITMNDLYTDIIKSDEIEGGEYLLKDLPTKNKIIKINQDGLVNVEYKVSDVKIEIEMLYDGGITNIILEKNQSNIKKTICYHFD